ncbi:Chromosomal replication initiator protein DnaA, partial [Bienertia sinuspersici]
MGEFFFNDFCSTPSCARKIGPLPTFELLTPSPTAVSAYSISSTVDTGAIVTEEISAKDISVTDNAIGDDSKDVGEGVSVSSPKDGQLIVADAGATGGTPEALEGDQSNKIQNDDDVASEKSSEHTPSPQVFAPTGDFSESLPIVTPLKVQRPHDDGSYSSVDRSARIPDVDIPEYIPQNTPEKVKEYIDLVEEEIDVDDSHLESLISDIEKSIENYSSTDEDIKKELGEEVGKNVLEDVGSSKMQQVSVDNEEKEIADDKNQLKAESSEGINSYNDLPVANCDIIVSRTLQLQRNKYLAELSDQERILADFLFYSEYQDVSVLSVDENNPGVIQQNEELRHTLECSVLLDIVNPANPDMHVCMTKTDFLSLAPKTWLTGASIDACSYLFNRREEENPGTPRNFGLTYFHLKKKEKIESIIAEKEIDLEKAKDNPCYDTMKAEWLKDKQKMTYRESAFLLISNHFTVLVFNFQKSMIEDIDNRSDNKSFAIYGEKPYDKVYELCHVLQSFLQGNRIKRRGFDGLHHWNRRTIPFTWRSNQNDFDCGVYCIKAMEWYDGWNEKKHPITTLSTVCLYKEFKSMSSCYRFGKLQREQKEQEVLKECALWSARKPFLIEQQKKRKDKEKHLQNLRVKRVEKVFVEDEKIKKERERHEQE